MRTTALAAACSCVLAVFSPIAAGHPGVAPLWQRDAACETGSAWDWGHPRAPGEPWRHNEGSKYEGGIGFAPSTWRWWAREVGVLGRYPHAYLAPPWVQAEVAQWGLDHVGRWGCLYTPGVM